MARALDLIVQHNLNATDAVGLRSVLDVQHGLQVTGDEVVLWSADKRLVRAAQRVGLATFDPETDTMEDFKALFNPA